MHNKLCTFIFANTNIIHFNTKKNLLFKMFILDFDFQLFLFFFYVNFYIQVVFLIYKQMIVIVLALIDEWKIVNLNWQIFVFQTYGCWRRLAILFLWSPKRHCLRICIYWRLIKQDLKPSSNLDSNWKICPLYIMPCWDTNWLEVQYPKLL